MRCLNIITFKRKGILYHVPCGKCIACLSNKSAEWQFRVQKEMEYQGHKAIFVTLTYDEEHVPQNKDGTKVLSKHDLQLFFRYLRRTGLPVRYFAKGEYGGIFQRPHYHLILFGLTHNLEVDEKIRKCWKKGFVTISSVTARRIAYVCKYMYKLLHDEQPVAEFRIMSKRPYIGYGYCIDPNVQNWHTDGLRAFAVLTNGVRTALPRTFREKIFSPVEQVVIALNNFDKHVQREREEFEEVFNSGNANKIDKYLRRDEDELRFQQSVIERIRYKEQLKKEQYEYIHKNHEKNSKEEYI